MTTSNLQLLKELEKAQDKKVREIFYSLCNNENPVMIKRAFMQSNIREKLNEETISFGLFGATKANKIKNVQIILDCVKQYQEIDLQYISYSGAINLSIEKSYQEITDLFLNNNICLKSQYDNIYILNYANICATFETPNYSLIDEEYQKFSKSSLKMFSNQSEILNHVLQYNLPYSKVQPFALEAIRENNQPALVSVVTSKYLDNILRDEEFVRFMDTPGYESTKQEFIYLIQNPLLEEKLNNKLLEKKTKNSSMKI